MPHRRACVSLCALLLSVATGTTAFSCSHHDRRGLMIQRHQQHSHRQPYRRRTCITNNLFGDLFEEKLEPQKPPDRPLLGSLVKKESAGYR